MKRFFVAALVARCDGLNLGVGISVFGPRL